MIFSGLRCTTRGVHSRKAFSALPNYTDEENNFPEKYVRRGCQFSRESGLRADGQLAAEQFREAVKPLTVRKKKPRHGGFGMNTDRPSAKG